MRRDNRNADNCTKPLALHSLYVNQGLFADNYLENRLDGLAEWRDEAGLGVAFQAVKQLYQDKSAGLANANEPQTEHDFIQPVLDIVWADESPGDCYQVQVIIPNLNGHRQPDYALFRAGADRKRAEALKGTRDYWSETACLGDAKAWGASLDKTRAADENPSAQIANYLYRAQVQWGILTNGRIWRLYEQQKASAGGVFFEVDLEAIVQHDDRAAFRYFFSFFSRSAFLPDSDGKTFVGKVLQGSVDYATQVGDNLKESVYDALRLLVNGFLEHPRNQLDARERGHVELAHKNGLIVLYRLLFLLYAEDKGLLPLTHKVYKDHSLRQVYGEINGKLRSGREYYAREHRFWPLLLRLFELIDNGLTDGDRVIIPAYNGGLFSPSKYPHVAHTPEPGTVRWDIGDLFLAQAIDMLSYKRERWEVPGTQDIDYKSLDVQHLGSIYEGLLELQPRLADEPLVETVKGGKATYQSEARLRKNATDHRHAPRRVPAGEVYLVTNRGERKATGSYYTPKYIVDYIVQNTVGPLADEAARKVAALRPAVDRDVAELESRLGQWEPLAKTEPGAADQVAKLRKEMDNHRRKLLDPYLSLKILDPAMGSGHFLVGAADFVSLAMATDPNLHRLEEMRNEEEQVFYKRLVVERCLCGVDLNPLAVELAKLSLWLHTVSRDKALSFLDHHLRCGNSLIGASIERDLASEPPHLNAKGVRTNGNGEQLVLGFTEALTATHLQYLLDTFREIMESPSGDAEFERRKAKLYESMDKVRERFRAVANCWLAPYFGMPVTGEQYASAVSALRNPADWPELEQKRWFRKAQEVAREKRFFHWELEFPEQFFMPSGFKPEDEGGFDVVIGNPPYGYRQIPSPQDKRFYQCAYATHEYDYEFYVYFSERGLRLLKPHHTIGLIVPNTFLSGVNFSKFRRLLLRESVIQEIVYAGLGVFEGVTVESLLLFVKSGYTPDNPITVRLAPQSAKREGIAGDMYTIAQDRLTDCIEIEVYGAKQTVVEKLDRVGAPLSEYAYVTVGINTGYIRKHLVAAAQVDKRYHKMLTGRDVGRYSVEWGGEWIAYDPELVAQYGDKGRTLPPEHVFSRPKLLLQRTRRGLAVKLVATYDDAAFYNLNRLSNVVLHDRTSISLLYLLALVDARLLDAYFNWVFQEYEVKPAHLRRLPVCPIEFITPEHKRESLGQDFAQLHRDSTDPAAPLAFAEDQLNQEPARTDVVHDILAFLAGRMIEMNKERGEEISGFVSWLERHIGASVDKLVGKTKLKQYHESDLPTLLGVLRQTPNRRRVKVNPDARSVQEEIEREFNASVARLAPLKARIADTDWLIDQIVYRLYGLTEEEIKIVEGQGGDPSLR